jgi:3-oxoacyl-[acyl-carrier protein] reductase
MHKENGSALITGGARGIGAAVSRRLSRDGHAVAIVDLDVEGAERLARELTEAGGRAIAVAADITDPDMVSDAVERISKELAPPLVLVNNAGVTRDNLLFRMGDDDWDTIMNVHLRGAFLVTRAVQKHMVDASWGRIVTMSSTSSLGARGQLNYATAKAGLQGFTKTLAVELGPFGVTANAIAPGFIETEMTAKTAERLGTTFEEFKASAASAIPVRRVGTVDDVASLVAFLASEETGFLSGQVIYLAGGPKV